MARAKNIFYHLVTNENTLTELVCNLLRYQVFRVLLTRVINEALHLKETSFTFPDVSSQRGSGKAGRPDVRIENERCCILLECKVGNSPLTPAQRRAYREVLEASRQPTKALLFILPDGYFQTGAIDGLIADAEVTDISVGKVLWGRIMDLMEQQGLAETNEVFAQFIALLTTWSARATISFEREGLKMLYRADTGAGFYDLVDLIEAVGKHVASDVKVKWARDEDGYGFYLKDAAGKDATFFGVDFEFWKGSGFPLCVAAGLPRTIPAAGVVRRLVRPPFSSEHWDYVGVPPEFMSQNNNATELKVAVLEIHALVLKGSHRKSK